MNSADKPDDIVIRFSLNKFLSKVTKENQKHQVCIVCTNSHDKTIQEFYLDK